ncbi:MAG: sulfate adenylyltransferase [Gammaproteobacteria bacterium]
MADHRDISRDVTAVDDGPAPHGGRLVDRVVAADRHEETRAYAATLARVRIDARAETDLSLIGVGALSPLDGFLTRHDYESVVPTMRLASGVLWPLPITLHASRESADRLKEGSDIALVNEGDDVVGLMNLDELYGWDWRREARLVYGTEDLAHPGVAYLAAAGPVLLGGTVTVLRRWESADGHGHQLDPAHTRAVFRGRGWRTIVGFQTRNPIHRSHEYIQKCALELVDGLFLHPLIGATKEDDVPADVRLRCYRVLMERYFPPERVLLATFPASMRYAGPREALFHALVRKNYGCTHFIVGRDAAGVGQYYPPYGAHDLIRSLPPADLGIVPLLFAETFFCRRCDATASARTCPHDETQRVTLSGSKVRELLRRGERLPTHFTRPEVADVLEQWIPAAAAR